MCGVRGERDRRRGRREKHLLWSCLSALRSLIASCSPRAVPAAPQAEAGVRRAALRADQPVRTLQRSFQIPFSAQRTQS